VNLRAELAVCMSHLGWYSNKRQVRHTCTQWQGLIFNRHQGTQELLGQTGGTATGQLQGLVACVE
jgi:hypothetical protein